MFKVYVMKKVLIEQKNAYDIRNGNHIKGYTSFEAFLTVFSKEVREAIEIYFISQLRPPPKANDQVGQAWHRLYQTVFDSGPDMRELFRDMILQAVVHLPYTVTNPFYRQGYSELRSELFSTKEPIKSQFSIAVEIDKCLEDLDEFRKIALHDIKMLGQFKYCFVYNLNEYLYDVMIGTITGDPEKINKKFIENLERLNMICELMEYVPSFEEHFWAFFEFFQKMIVLKTVNLKTIGVDYFMKGLSLILEMAEKKGFGSAAMRFMISLARARSINLGMIEFSYGISKEHLLKSLPYTYESSLRGQVLEMMIFDILAEGSQNPSPKLVEWFAVIRGDLPYSLFIEDDAIQYLNACRKYFINFFDVGPNWYSPFRAVYYFLLEHYKEFKERVAKFTFDEDLDNMVRVYPDRELNYLRSLIRVFLAPGARLKFEMKDLQFGGFEYTIFEEEWKKSKIPELEEILNRITSPAQGGLFYRFQDPGVCHVNLLRKIKVFSDMFKVSEFDTKRQLVLPKQYEFKNHRNSGY